MSITIATTTEGGFALFAQALPANAETLVKDTATVLQAIETQLCPYDAADPGPHLKDTIHQEQKGLYAIDVVEGIGTRGQAIFTEYGTRYMGAEPHQTPAAALAWQTEMSKRLGKLFSP